ncbi:MAG TPA: DNA polymerase IV, partial [bacterium (Candidatus Stahlbacteria)]|nr:DNA polymerase IV [Candidatus Stahlbacteria bacterium]
MILHCDIDAFFAAVEVLLRPELKGRPVIVGGLPNERGVVATSSYEARRFGIRSGMALSVAYHLCPQGVFLRGDFHNYREYSERFFEILKRFSPVIEVVSLDEAYLDITGTRRLFGPPLVLGERIRKEMRDNLGLAVSIGIGRNRTIAKIATGLAKPDGIMMIPEDQEGEIIGPLDVSVLPGIGPKAEERLRMIGITKVSHLSKIPNWIIRSLLGREPSRKGTRRISRETTLSEDTNDYRFLDSLLFYLSDRAATAARSEGLKTRVIGVKVRFSDFETITRSLRREPTDLTVEIFTTARQLFKSAVKGKRKRIRLIGVALEGLMVNPDQPFLFQERRTRIDAGVDQVR